MTPRELLQVGALASVLFGCAFGGSRSVLGEAPDASSGYVERDFEIDDSVLANPERGYTLPVDILSAKDIQYVRSQGVRLAFAHLDLSDFRGQDISADHLRQLDTGFSRARMAGLKLVLRVHYDGWQGRDATLEQVLAHIKQLRPLLRKHSDIIATVQAGFIGAWGEWHSSQRGLDTPAAREAIALALLDALPKDRSLQLRSPVFKAELSDRSRQFAAQRERIGYHNDCAFAGDSDRGTYPAPHEQWRSYAQNDAAARAVGGETCELSPPHTDCGNAVAALRKQRWSYINAAYHPDVMATWTQQGCRDLIARDLGYRLAVVRASWPMSIPAGAPFKLEIDIDNLGYAAPFNPRPVYLVLQGPQERRVLLPTLDPRDWLPSHRTALRLSPTLPNDLPPGRYSVSLWLPDASESLRERPEYALRLANEATWVPSSGLNRLGEFEVRHDR